MRREPLLRRAAGAHRLQRGERARALRAAAGGLARGDLRRAQFDRGGAGRQLQASQHRRRGRGHRGAQRGGRHRHSVRLRRRRQRVLRAAGAARGRARRARQDARHGARLVRPGPARGDGAGGARARGGVRHPRGALPGVGELRPGGVRRRRHGVGRPLHEGSGERGAVRDRRGGRAARQPRGAGMPLAGHPEPPRRDGEPDRARRRREARRSTAS